MYLMKASQKHTDSMVAGPYNLSWALSDINDLDKGARGGSRGELASTMLGDQ